jgi:hypothetical protein
MATQAGRDEAKVLILRVPVELREQIVSEARKNHRTISGEIRMRLERDLSRDAAQDRGAAA